MSVEFLIACGIAWLVGGITSIRPFILTDPNLKQAEKEGRKLPLKYFSKMFGFVIIGGGLSFGVAIYLVITTSYHTEPPEALFEG